MFWNAWEILRESAPFILLGFLLAGLLEVLLFRRQLTGLLRGDNWRSVLLATLMGIPLPLCSCSVLPTALTLKRKGAGKGATLAFLISTPETGVTSILLTYGLIGPFMAIYRPVAACVTGLIAGVVQNVVEHRFPQQSPPAGETPHQPCGCSCGESAGINARTAGPVAAAAGPAADCCDRVPPAAAADCPEHGPRARWRFALRYAFRDLFDDIFGWVLIGIIVAAAIQAWLPPDVLSRIVGGPWRSMLLMVLVGVPLYVCAEASTPIAAALLAGGLSPGAALVFLLVGPATNIGSIGVLARQLGKRTVAIYLAAIVGVALAMGALANWLLAGATAGLGTRVLSDPYVPDWLKTASAASFLGLGIVSVVRLRYVPRLVAWVDGRLAPVRRRTVREG